MGESKINVAISGATGFVGGRLSEWLVSRGYRVIALGRELFSGDESRLVRIISESDVVVNLAGAPLNHRWTEEYKKELIDSRITVTRKIVNAINATDRVKLLVSTSAVGYYPSEGCFDESLKEPVDNFLGSLCQAWEAEARKVKAGVRLAITRFGVVFAPQGGAFHLMTTPARMGASVVFGKSDEGFAWIDREDLIRATEYIIKNENLNGVFNYVAPETITQGCFAHTVARYYHSPLRVRVPEFVFRTMLGEAAEFVAHGQCVKPTRLLNAGYVFTTPDLNTFLKNLNR